MPDMRKAREAIRRAKRVAIASHINPDGDSIGSLLSLGLGLEKLGKRVYFLSVDGVPSRYRLLPGAKRIRKDIPLSPPVDLAIAVDCSNREILGSAWNVFRNARQVLEIDHHEFRRPFADISFVEPSAAAVGELVYLLLKQLKVGITPEIAQNLLTSVIVETASFRLPNVRPFTFELCAELIANGGDFYKLVDMVFWSQRRESAVLSGICLSRCKFMKGGRLAWSIIRRNDFEKTGGRDEDVDAVADEMRSIQGVEIAVLFRETGKAGLRVSLRSKDKINIGAVAEYFGGGGHFDVAGCAIPDSRRFMQQLLARAAGLL